MSGSRPEGRSIHQAGPWTRAPVAGQARQMSHSSGELRNLGRSGGRRRESWGGVAVRTGVSVDLAVCDGVAAFGSGVELLLASAQSIGSFRTGRTARWSRRAGDLDLRGSGQRSFFGSKLGLCEQAMILATLNLRPEAPK